MSYTAPPSLAPALARYIRGLIQQEALLALMLGPVRGLKDTPLLPPPEQREPGSVLHQDRDGDWLWANGDAHTLPPLGIMESADNGTLRWAWSAFEGCSIRVTTKDGNKFDAEHVGIGQVESSEDNYPAVLRVRPLLTCSEDSNDVDDVASKRNPIVSIPLTFIDRVDLY